MIRVTFDNGTVREYEGCVWDIYDDGEEIAILGLRHFLPTSRIVKFEKQVKSLTLEELDSVALHLHPYTTKIDYHPGKVLITYLGWDGVDYASEAEYLDTLDFNEYVDITYLIKGE